MLLQKKTRLHWPMKKVNGKLYGSREVEYIKVSIRRIIVEIKLFFISSLVIREPNLVDITYTSKINIFVKKLISIRDWLVILLQNELLQ